MYRACIHTHAYANGVHQSDHVKWLVLDLLLGCFVASMRCFNLFSYYNFECCDGCFVHLCFSSAFCCFSCELSRLHDYFSVPSFYSVCGLPKIGLKTN